MTSEPNPPDGIDLEAMDANAMLRHARTATFAPNWRSVLAADALVGVMITIGGVVVARWFPVVGLVIVAVGGFYVFLVVRRFLQWRWLRRRAGLDGATRHAR